jgi:hypothetical protein
MSRPPFWVHANAPVLEKRGQGIPFFLGDSARATFIALIMSMRRRVANASPMATPPRRNRLL